ncbi:MAG: T9SS type A sorting domain-containing protein [Bacteroidia bacterium]
MNINFAQSVISWSNTGASTAWLTSGNWTGNVSPSTGDVAQFNNAGTANQAGINMNTLGGALSIAGIEATSARTTNNLTVGNSSAVSGTLTLSGGVINSIPNTIVRSASNKNLTIQDAAGGTGLMGVALTNTVDSKVFLDGSGNITIASVISGPAGCPISMQGAGSGVINITGVANTFSGQINILGSETVFSADGGFGAVPAAVIPNAIVIDGGRMTANATYTLNANRGIQVGITAGTSISVKTSTSILTYNGTISDKVPGGSWAKQGGNLLLLGGSSVYTGSTAINNGTVGLTGGNDRLPVTTVLGIGQNASTNLGTFDMNGKNQQISGLLSTAGTNASASKNRVINSAGSSTLTISGSSTYTYGAGTPANSGVISGSITVVKSGTGLQILGDVNSWSGATTINGGELRFNPNANETLTTSAVTLNGGTLGTAGISMNVALSFSTLALTDNSTISLDALNTHSVSFAASSSTAWTAAKTLTISGWQGTYNTAAGSPGTTGRIFVGSTASDLTAAQLSQIVFFDGTKYYAATLLSTGELVPYCVAPNISAVSSSTSICVGTNLNLSVTATGTVAPGFIWIGPNSFSSAVQNPTITGVSTAASGIYTISASNSCGTFTASVSVTVSPLPTITVSPVTICSGQTATIAASGASTYTWSTGANTSTIIITPTVTTTYTVSGTQAGCDNSNTTTVTVNASPSVTVNSGTICAGGTATLTANGASTYTWSTGANTSAINVTPTITTTYTVSGTQAGCDNSNTAMITVNPLPLLTVNSATICAGGSVTLTANGASSYTWSTAANTSSITVSPTATTNYTVSGTTALGCIDSISAIVAITSSPSIAVNSATLCAGSSATLTASGVSTYTWSTGSNSLNIVVSPTATSVYTVSGNASGCPVLASTTTTVTVNALPSLSVSTSNTMLCAGQTATLTAAGAATYTWSTGSNSVSIPVTPGVTTSYTITGSTSAGCSDFAVLTQTVSACTGINALEAGMLHSIYPNPAKDWLMVNFGAEGSVREVYIYDSAGKLIYTTKESNSVLAINTASYPTGLYNLIITSEGRVHTSKFIKE